MAKTAMVFGATGLVGGHLVALLAGDDRYGLVICPGRRPPSVDHPKVQFVAMNMDELPRWAPAVHIDEVYCCLGTTMKQAGSRAAFRRVDHDYVLATAQLAKRIGADRYLWVSATTSSPGHPSFHLRIKGEVDEAIRQLQLRWYKSVRPSLILGSRESRRPAEQLAGYLFVPIGKLLLHGALRKYRAIDGAEIAHSLREIANEKMGNPDLEVWP